MARAGQGFGPCGHHVGELSGVFVVGGHLDCSSGSEQLLPADLGTFDLLDVDGLLFDRSRLLRAGVFQQLKLRACDVEGAEARRAEEDDSVLYALAAEARHRFLVLGDDAQQAAVSGVDEVGVLVGERRLWKRVRGLGGHIRRSSPIVTRDSRGSARPLRCRSRCRAGQGQR